MNLVWTKLVVILSCTLAGDRGNVDTGGWNLSFWGSPNVTVVVDDDRVCASTCNTLNPSVRLPHVVIPILISAAVWFLASLPVLFMQSRWKTLAVRACLWQLMLLWLNLVIAYVLFTHQRVYGYIWAIYASVHTLTAWAPHRRVLVMVFSHRLLMLCGVAALCAFAWQMGPPIGLIAWRSGWPSQCGLSAHLMAILGVDFVGWVLTPLGVVVLGGVS
jgi:hypothetical protein